MKSTPHQRALPPLIGLQSAMGSLSGFIVFFVIGTQDLHAIFRYTTGMLTTALATIFLTYFFGPRFHFCGRRLLRLGVLIPGLLLLISERSAAMDGNRFRWPAASPRHWPPRCFWTRSPSKVRVPAVRRCFSARQSPTRRPCRSRIRWRSCGS